MTKLKDTKFAFNINTVVLTCGHHTELLPQLTSTDVNTAQSTKEADNSITIDIPQNNDDDVLIPEE